MNTYIVYRSGRKVDTIYRDYTACCEQLRRELVQDGKYGPNISVQKDASKAYKDRNRRH